MVTNKTIRNIQYGAAGIVCLIVIAQIYVMSHTEEDTAGVVASGIFVAIVTVIVATILTVALKGRVGK